MPIPGCLGPFGGAKVPSGVPGPIFKSQAVFGGGRFPHGVPVPISGCLGLFWGSRIPSGVPEPIPGCLGLFWGTNTHPGAPEPILGWPGVFWNARICSIPFWDARINFGVPGSLPGLPSRGTRVYFGVPTSLGWGFVGSFALRVLLYPKTPGCPMGSHFGVAAASFGVPAPPIGLGASGSRSGFLGLLVAEIWGHRAWRGLGAVLEGPHGVEGKGGAPKIGSDRGLCPPSIMDPPRGPAHEGRGLLGLGRAQSRFGGPSMGWGGWGCPQGLGVLQVLGSLRCP